MGRFESNESAFNFAVAYLQRVNELLYIASKAQAERRLKDWFDVVKVVFEEVNIKFSDEEIKSIEQQAEEIQKEFFKNPKLDLGDYIEKWHNGQIIRIANHHKERQTLYEQIQLLQRKIKKLADKRGMLLPGKNDPKFAVLER